MYSEENDLIIKAYEREAFRSLKELENKNKKIPLLDDVLYISDFTLEEFYDKGDSGSLYLATNKHNKNDKYIIKHEYYDCACNEYMYSQIGNKMGIKIAPVKLFILNEKDDRFKSDFVCGIKYLENCEHINFPEIEKEKNNISNWQDYFKIWGLESLFEEGDGIEVLKYNNQIYRIDTTDAFTISHVDIYMLAYDYNSNGINLREFAKKIFLEIPKEKQKIESICGKTI